jgi:HEAT repeat protein
MMERIQDLLRTIETGNPETVWEAAKELEALATDLASSLISLLRNAEHVTSRAAAAYVLGFGQFADARTDLEQALDNHEEDAHVRGHAAEALAYIQCKESVDALLRNLKDEDLGVKYWCTFALGRLGDGRALPALRNLAENVGDQMYEQHSLHTEALDAIDAINERLKSDAAERGGSGGSVTS